MQNLDSTTIRYIYLNTIMENSNKGKEQKNKEIHEILKMTEEEILNNYYLEHKQNKINLEETYSSLFKGSDINENKKNK